MLLEILDLSRSTYYYQVKRLAQGDKDIELKHVIREIYDEHKGNYGYRRIHMELRNRGFVVNHKKVQRLMKVMGLFLMAITVRLLISLYLGLLT
ncbi:transposase [Streptococcus pyogenes]|nr:transposase [Streptococcus pyogenes]